MVAALLQREIRGVSGRSGQNVKYPSGKNTGGNESPYVLDGFSGNARGIQEAGNAAVGYGDHKSANNSSFHVLDD